MYRGIRLDGMPRVTNYDEAFKALELRAKRSRKVRAADVLVPGGDEAPLGHPRSEVTGVRMDRDEAIRFRLYATDVVIYHKDGSVTLEGYPSKTTSEFAWSVTPYDLVLRGDRCEFDGRVCQLDLAVTFRRTPTGWRPDEEQLAKQCLVRVRTDRKLAAKITAGLNLKQFDDWMSMAPRVGDVRWHDKDPAACVKALRDGDFRAAAGFLPLIELKSRGFRLLDTIKPYPLVGVPHNRYVLPASIEQIKVWALGRGGALQVEHWPWLSESEYRQARKSIKKIERVGLSIYSLERAAVQA